MEDKKNDEEKKPDPAKMMKRQRHGFVAHKEGYKVEIGYSRRAVTKELIRLVIKKGDSVELSIRELVDLVAHHFNKKRISPLIVQNNVIRMTEVTRTIQGTLNKDMKAGEPIVLQYKHLIPYDFAVAEEAMELCKVQGRPIIQHEISEKDFEDAKLSIDEKTKSFIELNYQGPLQKIAASKKTDSENSQDSEQS